MEKICGFLDKNNKFHKTEKECEKSNLRINIRETEESLDNFSDLMELYLFKNYNWNSRVKLEYDYHKDIIKKSIAECVLLNSDEFIKIINKKKKIECALDLLRKEKDYQDKWWIKIIWWK